MSRLQGPPTWPTSARVAWHDAEGPRPFAPTPTPTAVLIPAPTVRPARRPSPRAAARFHRRGGSNLRPRRRLRREIRAAGALLVMIAPMVLAVALLRAAPTSTLLGGAADRADGSSVRPPSISLSIESPEAPRGTPVILPGYLLPDDGTEEPAHAGG